METDQKQQGRGHLAPGATMGNQTLLKIIVDHKYVNILMKQVRDSIWIWHSHVLRSWRKLGASRATDWSPRGIGATKQSQQVRERTKTQKVITYQLKRGSVSGVERVHSKESFSMVAVFHGKGEFPCSNPKKLTQNTKIWRFIWNCALFWHCCVETSRPDNEFSFFSCFLHYNCRLEAIFGVAFCQCTSFLT